MRALFTVLLSLVVSVLTIEAVSYFLPATPTNHSEVAPDKPSFPREFELRADWSQRPARENKPQRCNRRPLKLTGDPLYVTSHQGFQILGASSKIHQEVRDSDGREIFKADYNIDFHNRRVTPRESQSLPRYHLAIAGCSFVFGIGLADDQTLPSELQRKFPETKVYNLGMPGGGIAEAIGGVTKFGNWDGLKPRRGILLAAFSGEMHLDRFLGTITNVGGSFRNAGTLELDSKTDRYAYAGTFESYRPFWTAVSWILSRSNFLTKIGFEWPRQTEGAFQNYAKALDDLRFYYRKKFREDNPLVVVIYPFGPRNHMLIPYLERRKIPYLDYTDFPLASFVTGAMNIDADCHPTHSYNQVFADQIALDLGRIENQQKLGFKITQP